MGIKSACLCIAPSRQDSEAKTTSNRRIKLLHRRMPCSFCDLLPGLGCEDELLHKSSQKHRSQKASMNVPSLLYQSAPSTSSVGMNGNHSLVLSASPKKPED